MIEQSLNRLVHSIEDADGRKSIAGVIQCVVPFLSSVCGLFGPAACGGRKGSIRQPNESGHDICAAAKPAQARLRKETMVREGGHYEHVYCGKKAETNRNPKQDSPPRDTQVLTE